MNMYGLHHVLNQGVHNKNIYDLVFFKYISDPLLCLYNVTYTLSEESSFSSFRFVTIGVLIDLQYNIPNIFKMSIVYFQDTAILQGRGNSALCQGISSQILLQVYSYSH